MSAKTMTDSAGSWFLPKKTVYSLLYFANMEKILKECNERWKPEPNEVYYYVNQVSATSTTVNGEFDIDVARYRTYNCFKTKEEAKREAEKILIRRQLEDIARRLNKGQKIDWDDYDQPKYFISLYYGGIVTDVHFSYKLYEDNL